MPVTKKDGKGVFRAVNAELWFYRTYHTEALNEGPYATRAEAMEALLHALGFDVEAE